MLELQGRVVALAKSEPERHFVGRVRFAGGIVDSVLRGRHSPPAGVEQVDVGDAYIYPGLTDLHSHLGFATLPLWHEPTRTVGPWMHRDLWPGAASYKPAVSWPAYAYMKGAPEALLVYAQVRALAGGTTTIQGWPNANVAAAEPARAQRRRRHRPRRRADVGHQPHLGRARRSSGAARRWPHARVPPLRRAAREQGRPRVRRRRHGRLPPPPSDRHSLLRGRRRRVPPVEGARRARRPEATGRRRVVAVLEPVALQPDDRRGSRPSARRRGLARLRLGSVRHEEPARRVEGRAHLDPARRRRSHAVRARRDGDLDTRRPARPSVGRSRTGPARAGPPRRRAWCSPNATPTRGPTSCSPASRTCSSSSATAGRGTARAT